MARSTNVDTAALLQSDAPKLFIIDARHSVERTYLIDWLKNSAPNGVGNEKLDWVSLPISDERKKMQLDKLAARLEVDETTLVIPVRVIWRVPNFDRERSIKLRHLIFGNPRLPNSLRARSILLRDKRRAHCIAGQPAKIGEMRQHFEEQTRGDIEDERQEFAAFVARQAGLVLDIVERGLRGSRYKMPRFVTDAISAQSDFRKDVRALSEEEGKPRKSQIEKSRRYLRELVARPTPAFLDLRARFDRFLLGQGYNTQLVHRPEELTRLKQIMRDHPTLLLFTHKTYLDGITPAQLLYQNDMPMLHVFGGINLDFFGLGALFRKSGIIFIRRSFADNKLYRLTLRHYIAYLLRKRFPMSWSFEGTRSRLGKLMPPKYGLLKYVLDAAHESNIENLHIVPFVTSFDIINDVEEYAMEQTGRVKKPESLAWFIGYLRSLRRPLGRIYIDLGEPVVLKTAPDPEDRLGLSKIAFDVSVKANEATPLTLTSLMCMALLATTPRALTAEELRRTLRFTTDWARKRNIRLSPDLDHFATENMRDTIDNLVNTGLLLRDDMGARTVYAIAPGQHPIASYYRNSISHHFLYKSIAELALFKAREIRGRPAAEVFWEETGRLRDLFKFEFYWPEKDEFRKRIENELALADSGWAEKLAAAGPHLKSLTHRLQPLQSHAVFLPFVEAYAIVLDILAHLEPGEDIDEKSLIEVALKESRQALMLRRITSEASIGKILFQNGFKMAESLDLTGPTTENLIKERKALLKKFRGLSRRMDKSRIEVLALADTVFE